MDDKPDYEEISCPDGRRGLWVRTTQDENGLIVRLEFAAGRDGDDSRFDLRAGEVLSAEKLYLIHDALAWLPYSQDLADDAKRSRTIRRRLGLQWYKLGQWIKNVFRGCR